MTVTRQRSLAKPYLENMVSNPTGYSPADLTALRTGASDQVAQGVANAKQAVQANEAAHDSGLPSGVNEQINASVDTAGAQQGAAAQREITEQDDQLKLQNYWKAIGALSGQAELEAPQSYAGAATSAGNSVANLSQAVLASQQAGWQDFGGVLSGIGGLATGAGSIGKGFGLCWIAAAIYGGWLDARTITVRRWIMNDLSRTWYGAPLVWLYAKTGRQIAKSKLLVSMLKPVFDLALMKAQEN